MEQIPSVWGRHEQALIDPMLIRGKFITSIMEAPEDWNGRLAALGFKKTNSGWVKLGALQPSEFAYLSPDIDLIGLRPDEIHEAITVEPDIVPLDVKDALLSLWQRQHATVMVALSMEHEKNHTRAQAWSFVEAALAGEVTPETETLYGLTLTKLSRDMGTLSAQAQAFADDLGWKGLPSRQKASPEKILFNKGETVQWFDADGVLQLGRLAKKVGVTEPGCWVYQSPRWVGGYTFASPQWVSRSQLYFANAAQDWLNEQVFLDLIQETAPQEVSRIGDELMLDYTPSQLTLLTRMCSGPQTFPPLGGVEAYFNKMREADSFNTDAVVLYVEENLAWLKDLEAQLSEAARLTYGSDSVLRFAVNTDLFEEGDQLVRKPALTICVQLGHQREMSRSSAHSTSLAVDGRLAIGPAARIIEQARSNDERTIRDTSRQLAILVGEPGKQLAQASDFHGASMMWVRAAAHLQGQVSTDDVLRMLSVVLRGNRDMQKRLHGRDLLPAFDAYLFAAPHEGASLDELQVSVKAVQCELVSLEDIARTLQSASENADWITSAGTSSAMLYEASVNIPQKSTFVFSREVSQRRRGVFTEDGNRNLVATPDEAIAHYVALLDQIEPLADVASQDKMVSLRKLAGNYKLYERLLAVPKRLAEMPPAELRQQVKAQIYMQEAKRVSQVSEQGQERLIGQVSDALIEANSQGAVVLFSTTSAGFRWRTQQVPIDAETLDQTRRTVLELAMLKLKNRVRGRGVGLLVDGIAIADPELAELLNGEGPAQLKEVVKTQTEGYQDTGVVAGWAMKDIRGMRRVDLLDASEQMSDQQKAKYLTRELIWPRKSFEEMKEAGVDLQTAYAFDTLWKALPKAPLTSSRAHVRCFVNVLTSMKEAVEPLLKLPFDSTSNNEGFADAVKSATAKVWFDQLSGAEQQMYWRQTYIRGYGRGLSWNTFAPGASIRFLREIESLSWSDVLKTKKVKSANPAASRVARGELVRKGPDYRQGKTVSGEDFIRTFGFSGVEYGNWTSQKEREKHLNLAYDSMMDFVRIMGWEPMTLSLGGKLGLCIGSRGRGGKNAANAHFEPVNMAINLTRMRGDGALAHEYFHAVANHYGRLATGSPVDVTDTFGYVLQQEGEVPALGRSGLRPDVQKAFNDLVVAIMRKPECDDDDLDITRYTKRSDMLMASMAMDDGKKQYWGSPSEMFARSMEVWFKDRLSEAGEQNDYLVRADKGADTGGVYPDAEHLKRINHFVSPWLDSIRQEVSQVAHPFLGDVQMPILNTELRSVMPLTHGVLAELAATELDRLFRGCAPELLLIDDPVYRAGMYDLSRDIITLNTRHADKGTFYHEAWHACHEKLLTSEERFGLSRVFDVDGPLAEQIELLLREQGVSDDVIGHMRSDTREVQAYAFQLWQEGRFAFEEPSTNESKSFYRVGTFVEGVAGVGEYFGEQEVQRLFTRFMSGELADRAIKQAQEDCVSWDEDNVLYWEGPLVQEAKTKPRAALIMR